MFQMKEFSHENINAFIGATFGEGKLFLIEAYCSKGSLQDILMEDEIKLDWMFKASLINDIVNVGSLVESESKYVTVQCVIY